MKCDHLTRGGHCTRCVNARRQAQRDLEKIAPVRSGSRRRVIVRHPVRSSAVVFDEGVAGYDVRDILRTVTSRVMKAPSGKAWLVHHESADDAMAALECAKYDVRVVAL